MEQESIGGARRVVTRNHSLRNVARRSAEGLSADDDYARANPSKRCGVCDSSLVKGQMYLYLRSLRSPNNKANGTSDSIRRLSRIR